MKEETQKDETFRDSLATVTEEGKRKWVFPRKPSGKFYNARTIVSIFLIAFLFGAPFIKINGHPFILLNFLERKFIIFSIPFGPHDFHLFGLAMIAVFVSIFLFTVIYGRIFCGWICPQTVFMEMLFRKIEYFIEGDSAKQRALKNSTWTKEKFFKKTIKHLVFFGLSFVVSNTFLAYIIGIDELFKIISEPPWLHLGGLTAITIFSIVFYWVFSYFREQACTIVCPYGRLQGVMLDQNSIVIAYDFKRGEPRGKLKKDVEQNFGDCIDCRLCVDVCPTGIDIRNGTQLECVNCTACIDACDSIMKKIDRPPKLIKYASLKEIETGVRNIFSARAIGYSVVLVILLSLISLLLLTRTQVELSILRTPGLLYQEQSDDKISNLYDLQIINKTFDSFQADISLKNIKGEIKIIGSNLKIESQEVEEAKFFVILPKESIKQLNTPIEIAVNSNGKPLDVIRTSFLGKIKKEEPAK
ncbi:MAG: cytochrome c oxidase accessory protein CcoG [bacterium]